MAKSKALTALTVGKITKPGAHRDHGDGAAIGLYLQVSEAERGRVKDAEHGVTRSWIYRFTSPITGKPRWMGLGPTDVIGLAKARELAKDARLKVKLGLDPIEERLKEREDRRARERENICFKDAAEQFIELHAPSWKNKKHRAQWGSTLEAHAYRQIGGRPVSVIDPAVINETLAPIWGRIPETALRVRQRIERIVQWVKDGKPLPAQNGKGKEHNPALPYEQVPEFMSELRERGSISARALELTILCCVRTGDTIVARWEEVDLDARLWRIAEEEDEDTGKRVGRHKTGKTFEVPLSTRAIEILQTLPRVKDNPYVFVGKAKQSLSNGAMAELLKGMHNAREVAGQPAWADGDSGRLAVPHGFRSTFRDWAGDRTNFAREVIEAAMSHRIKDKAEASYRRRTALEKRGKLMEAWSGYCMAPPAEGKVLSIGGARG